MTAMAADDPNQSKKDWLLSFLEDDAQLNGPYPDITQKEADAEAWRQRDRDKNVEEYDEMYEF